MNYEADNWRERLQHLGADVSEPALFTDAAADEIRIDSNIPDLIPVVRIAGEVIAVQGDISFIAGKPKAGKTAVCTFIAASALLRDKSGIDTLSIQTDYAYGKEVILVDTEQPKANTLKQVKNICKVLDVADQPANLHVFNFREDNKAIKLLKVKQLFEIYPKAHLWIIDGLADLIDDVNSATDSGRIVDMFMMYASKLQTTILLLVHENPGGEGKMRGHLGSEAERKGGGVIAVAKDKAKQLHTITSRILRNGPDFETVYFRWSDKRHFFVTDADAAEQVVTEKHAKERQLALECFPLGTDVLRHKEITARIEQYAKVKTTRAASLLKAMTNAQMVVKDNVEGTYTLHESLTALAGPDAGIQTDLLLSNRAV
ncbi:AAA family ATPase [Hymenobacter psychrophilus]|uniref:AAA domain-containing protein n=1 Tax=Hymenobacter psychrophilus TaxID=651662 RepID=A0A1H3DR32_9BACT|nr:AAA family ATPase [Hymenobacter psychrophilus]SDX68119.1 AAA domain-containing protein [Hymenobacter psychrophilus]